MSEFEIFFAALSAAATTAAAIAAYMSWSTSRASLIFQENFAKNQTTILQLTSLMTNTQTLSSLLMNVKTISEAEFDIIEPLFLESRDKYRNFVLNKIINEDGNRCFQYSDFAELIDNLSKSKIALGDEIYNIKKAIDRLI